MRRHDPRISGEGAAPGPQRRRGITIIEMVVASGLFGVLTVCLVPTLSRLATFREDVAARQLALRELRNLAERVVAGEEAEQLSLSDAVQAQLGEPRLDVNRATVGEPVPPVRLSLTWENSAGQRELPVELWAWPPVDSGKEGQE